MTRRMEFGIRVVVDVDEHRHHPTVDEVGKALIDSANQVDLGTTVVVEANPHEPSDWRRYDADEWSGYDFSTVDVRLAGRDPDFDAAVRRGYADEMSLDEAAQEYESPK